MANWQRVLRCQKECVRRKGELKERKERRKWLDLEPLELSEDEEEFGWTLWKSEAPRKAGQEFPLFGGNRALRVLPRCSSVPQELRLCYRGIREQVLPHNEAN